MRATELLVLRFTSPLALAGGVIGLTTVASGAVAQSGTTPITYARHVAPILQEKCQVCHRPNSIGPMSLLTYEDAKRYAPLIKVRVSQRIMPPWHIDKTVGVQEFKNDRSLTDEQIQTIVRWVDDGAPLGDRRDLPPPMEFPDPTGARGVRSILGVSPAWGAEQHAAPFTTVGRCEA